MIILPDGMPVIETLRAEGLSFFPGKAGNTKNPVRIGILNLMPIKPPTEADFVRVLSASPLPIQIVWMRLRTHVSKHCPAEHLDAYYNYADEVMSDGLDGLIVTGAPLEFLPFEGVTYWPELTRIFDWARLNVRSTLYICWAAQAGLYYHYGVDKTVIEHKRFGIFEHTIHAPNVPLFRGFDTTFHAPHSRHTTITYDALEAGINSEIGSRDGLQLICNSTVAGVHTVMAREGREFFITGHSEYHPLTLDNEYRRDLKRGIDIQPPMNYYIEDNPEKGVNVTWRAHATLLYTNWLHYYVAQPMPPVD